MSVLNLNPELMRRSNSHVVCAVYDGKASQLGKSLPGLFPVTQ